MALSSTRAEYVGLSEVAKMVVWLQIVKEDLDIAQQRAEIAQDILGKTT